MCRRTAKTTRTPGAKCRLHVAFHGCEQYVDKIHGLFFRDAGYNDWADTHHVIILYPQATPWLRFADLSQIAIRRAAGIGGAIQERTISVAMASKCALYAR